MALQKTTYVIFHILVFIFAISCQEKSSLTFVIDRTNSMRDDINQVMEAATDIMDIMHSKQSSQIQNVILVTFDDIERIKLPADGDRKIPGFDLVVKTDDRLELQRQLYAIEVVGNWDCPEMSLSGTRLGLQESLPGSYVYVFTDDGPRDLNLAEEVRNLAQRKQNQVVFVITPNDNCPAEGKSFKEYYAIAAATSGQVFRLTQKSDVKSVLTYVEEAISGLRTIVTSRLLPPNEWSDIDFTIDDKTEYGIVSTSGIDVYLSVTQGPSDNEKLTWLDNVKIMKLKATGNYTVRVKGSGTTSVMVFGRSDFTFKHGFSVFKPSSLDETATQPIPGWKSYLTVKVIDKEGDVKVKTLKILDMQENLIIEKPLEMLDVKNNLYVTEPFELPNTTFKIAIVGYGSKTTNPIIRTSQTPVEPQDQNLSPGPEIGITPVVVIEGGPLINAEYDEPLQLKCKVTAYPKPVISWVDKNGKLLDAKIVTIYLDSEYLSLLDIEKVNENSTYQCRAVNTNGEAEIDVSVETKRKTFFDVLEIPKDTTVAYQKSDELKCKVSAYPPAKVTWFINATEIKDNEHLSVSDDGFTLSIKNMQLETEGHYLCEARNDLNRKLFHADVFISGVDPPRLEKDETHIKVLEGTSPTLNCRVSEGKPKPSIRWSSVTNPRRTLNISSPYQESITLPSVYRRDSGIYKCEADNIVGHDYHEINLTVEYAPSIKISGNTLVANEEEIKLKCEVVGIPAPSIAWELNGNPIDDKSKHINSDNSLSFKATLEDIGGYTCRASNEHGTASETTTLDVFVAPSILPIAETVKVIMGRNILLKCPSYGYPEPKITWTFQNDDHRLSNEELSVVDGSIDITNVKNSQGGFYTCTATNVGGSDEATYEVVVLSPPDIINIIPNRRIKAVSGDLVVSIPCKATGNPKPSITWLKAGYPLVLDEYSYVAVDGTLFIGNIDQSVEGDYTCMAENELGKRFERYYIIIDDYPKHSPPTSTVTVELGNPAQIECPVQHLRTDQIRWYKGRKYVTTGTLILNNSKKSDSGNYTCRVSNFNNSVNGDLHVVVGYNPKFYEEQESELVEFEKDYFNPLECSADAYPDPKIEWWHNGKIMNYNEDSVIVGKNINDRGEYVCVVSNEFGNISRRFVVESVECLLNTKTDFNDLSPLMLTAEAQTPLFERLDEHIQIPRDDKIYLHCPNGFKNFIGKQQVVTCLRENKFELGGRVVEFANLICQAHPKPAVKRTGRRCSTLQTELLIIGYEIYDEFFEIYQVCFNKGEMIPVYTKHTIDQLLADHIPENAEWFKYDLLQMDFKSLYNCSNQIKNIHAKKFKLARKNDDCCFSERQLVNPRDVLPGLPQITTYSHLNVVPHWSTCHEENWNDVENRVRSLAINYDYSLEVWTGTSHKLKLDDERSQKKIFIRNGFQGQKQPVSIYLWKIIRDPVDKKSLAIIQVNVPDFELSMAYKYVKCKDICNQVSWMTSKNWHDPKRGYTYCCRIQDFSESFGVKLFDSVNHTILHSMPEIPNSDA